jgi:hypothetical protein
MPPRKKPAAPDFPPDCCGVCRLAHREADDWRCWAEAPRPIEMSTGELRHLRGAGVDPLWPACRHFLPHHHA